MTAALLDCVEINPESDPAEVVIWLQDLGYEKHLAGGLAMSAYLPASEALVRGCGYVNRETPT